MDRIRDIDVGVITIVPTEIRALFQTFGISDQDRVPRDSPFDYWLTEFHCVKANRRVTVVVTSVKRDAGNTESGICASYFLQDWYPRLMCLVGTAAGIHGKARIGDVVVPSKIQDRTLRVFRDGKFSTRGGSSHRPGLVEGMTKVRTFSADEFKLEYGSALTDDISRAASAAREKRLAADEFSGELQVLDGSLTSDNVLIRDEAYFAGIVQEVDEKCRGGDMESAGFVNACQTEDSDFPWLICRGISDFGDDRKDDSFQLLAAKSACIALRMYLEKCIDMDRLPQNAKAKGTRGSLEYNLLDQAREAFQAQRWEEVCRIGTVVSRLLWVSGQYHLRVEIGRLVADAAGYSSDLRTRAKALIDDLGWTNYMLGNSLEARTNIGDGERMAREVNDYYSVAKANRHMASMARQEGKLDEASRFLRTARTFAPSIDVGHERIEMLGSLLVSEGKLMLAKGETEQAVGRFEEAIGVFRDSGDRIRQSKVYALLGKAFAQLGKTEDALRLFYEGRKLAFSMGRFDEAANDTSLLIECLGEQHRAEELSMAKEVLQLARSEGLFAEVRKWKVVVDELAADKHESVGRR